MIFGVPHEELQDKDQKHGLKTDVTNIAGKRNLFHSLYMNSVYACKKISLIVKVIYRTKKLYTIRQKL